MVKYVNYGHPVCGIHMYVITMYRTEHGSYKVEVLPCDAYGHIVSDAIAWDIFPCWWDARKYVRQQYKEFYKYVNERR
jgi:hypothetical protein